MKKQWEIKQTIEKLDKKVEFLQSHNNALARPFINAPKYVPKINDLYAINSVKQELMIPKRQISAYLDNVKSLNENLAPDKKKVRKQARRKVETWNRTTKSILTPLQLSTWTTCQTVLTRWKKSSLKLMMY